MTELISIPGLLGGFLIGSAAAVYLLFNGRIAGMTGIMTTAVRDWNQSGSSARVFVAAALLTPLLLSVFVEWPGIEVTRSVFALVTSGVLVGVGVTLGSGCTSGHGVCGLSRLSRRSIVATLTFMVATALTVTLVRHVFGVTL